MNNVSYKLLRNKQEPHAQTISDTISFLIETFNRDTVLYVLLDCLNPTSTTQFKSYDATRIEMHLNNLIFHYNSEAVADVAKIFYGDRVSSPELFYAAGE